MTTSITWLLTEAERAVEKFRACDKDTEESKLDYYYWQDQVKFLDTCIEQHGEMNRLFTDLQAIETRIAKAYLVEKELHNGITVAANAIREAGEEVQRAKTDIAFAYTGD